MHAHSYKHVYLIFIATFLFGFLSGFLIFLLNNTGKEGDGAVDEVTRGMAITGEAYGGCMRFGCPSYRIENNGHYTYLKRDSQGEEKKWEDELTDQQLDTLRDELKHTDFDRLDDSEFTGTCPSTYDGLAFQYLIEYKGERYEVDSCIEEVAGEPLFTTLEKYFTVFALLYDQ